MARLAAPMADSDWAGGLLTVARGRERQDARDIGAELRLVRCDAPALIASLLHHGRGHLPLGQQGVHRADAALPHAVVQAGRHRRDLLGVVVHPWLGQRQAQAVGQGRHQVDSRRAWLARAPQRLALQRSGGCARRGRHGCAHDAPCGPGAPCGCHGGAVHVPQDRVPRRRPWCVVRKAQRLRETGTVMAPPCGPGALAALATHQRTTGQREHGGQGLACAPTTAKVRHLGEDLDEGLRLC
jgi:hypothetical protein